MCLRVLQSRPNAINPGDWLDRGTGVSNAAIQGMHLRLPGYGEDGPTLEIYQYESIEPKKLPVPNRLGFGHLAFEVDDVQATTDKILLHDGVRVGEISKTNVKGAGTLTFVYMADPEGNILEIQNWT